MAIFKTLDINRLGDSPIEQAIKGYKYPIASYYVGKLNNGNDYALIIDTSDEWVHVVAYNRAADPILVDYGFSVKEWRWSYGSNVLGAPQIREVIYHNMMEIKEIMGSQAKAREEKAVAREKYYAELEKAELIEESIQREQKDLLDNINTARGPIINKYFMGLEFKLNCNKRNHNAAQKDATSSYYEIDLHSMTCSCNFFQKHSVVHRPNDVRRLCYHLNQIVISRSLLMKDKDNLKDFVLKNVKGNLSGIYIGELNEQKNYCILVYSWTRNIFVATPKTNKVGFMMVCWSVQDKIWTPNTGSKVYNKQIKLRLDELFGYECNMSCAGGA